MKITAVPIGNQKGLIPDAATLKKVVQNAGRGTAKAIKADYDVTTQTWDNRPSFKIDEESWNEWLIYTESKIYLFVSGGTKPHIIRPRNANKLRFQWGGPGSYQAKTTPRVIASRSGGPSGPIVYRRQVNHPGTEAREFPKEIGKKWRREWPRNLARAIASAY